MEADAKRTSPELAMKREMMEKFRPEMRKHYLNRKPAFR